MCRGCAGVALGCACVECPAPFWHFGIKENFDAYNSVPKHAVNVPRASIKPRKNPFVGKT